MQRAQLTPLQARGMTLIEMVIVMVLLGILGASFGLFIVPMVNGYNAQVQRAALVDTGESALRRMARDIRIAVPNSARIATTGLNGGFALELVPTVDGGRFCVGGLVDCSSLGANALLDVNSLDAQFDIIGCFQDGTFTTAAAAGSVDYRLVVGNKGSELYAAAGSPKVITPDGTTITLSVDPSGACGSGGARHQVALSASHKFCPDATADDCNSRSPRQRVFVVDVKEAPVSYICDLNAGVQKLTRYSYYAFSGTQPTGSPGGGNLKTGVVATGVTACSINSAADIQNTGIVVISLTLADGANESVTLLHQAQIDNSQ